MIFFPYSVATLDYDIIVLSSEKKNGTLIIVPHGKVFHILNDDIIITCYYYY